MRLRRLNAKGVHGYLDFDIEFRDELTFLFGLNGSGKTSALRLLMGLLTPSFEVLSETRFGTASIEIESAGKTVGVSAAVTEEGIQLSISHIKQALVVGAAELQLLENRDPRKDVHAPLLEKLQSSKVVLAIQELSTPMFLGLDRRMASDDEGRWSGGLPGIDARHRRRYLQARMFDGERRQFTGSVAAGLLDVLVLVEETMARIRYAKDALDVKLRDDIVAAAFSYSPIADNPLSMPNQAKIKAIKSKQEAIKEAAEGLRLPRIQEAIEKFTDRMTELLEQVEGERKRQSGKGRSRKGTSPGEGNAVLELLMNQVQVERTHQLIQLLETYVGQKTELFRPMDRFLSLVNGFLEQTGKEIEVDERGRPVVSFQGKQRPLFALSSGERQIVVMLAHLALNSQLSESGIFIVDEPELSLHISWQQRFVRSVREANPNTQVILATHSPAIILDMEECCVPVRSEGVRG